MLPNIIGSIHKDCLHPSICLLISQLSQWNNTKLVCASSLTNYCQRFLQYVKLQTSALSIMILHSMNCVYEEAHNQSKGLCIKTQYLLSTTPKRFLQFTTHQTSLSNMTLHPMNCFYEEAHNQSKGLCMKTQYLRSTTPKRFVQYVTLQTSALSIMILRSTNCFYEEAQNQYNVNTKSLFKYLQKMSRQNSKPMQAVNSQRYHKCITTKVTQFYMKCWMDGLYYIWPMYSKLRCQPKEDGLPLLSLVPPKVSPYTSLLMILFTNLGSFSLPLLPSGLLTGVLRHNIFNVNCL
ncbi:uncharacterized protein LOC127941523 isoform X3 [Carassius gibelio]|uniref:uncharacterized protein LOC127941523 isoform X3 n=1 Tax=Carassius gibelio TaxID=101364 RepID=UPI00227949DF|nr:uncharacterized protein LOC127941523 isoform X3 [Carassius gibelio]